MSSAATTVTKKDKFTYDEVPYASFPYIHTHPDNLAMIGSLFGMSPAALATARVLEIGCAGGGNILPLALRYPEAKFTGFDLSQEQIDTARAQQASLGVKNIQFDQMNIMDFDLKKHKGEFDYIICHGVYSWVPEAVSARILELCRECLSADGLALISYNTLPGWNAVRSLCEMMRFHTNRFTTPADKVREAKKLLSFLSETAPEGSGYKSIIEEEQKHLVSANDSYFYHDHLEEVNRQFYFHQFAADINKHGLAYVGDTTLSAMFIQNLSQKAMNALKVLNDVVLQEQYIDFVLNRRFRSSIICKQGRTINRNLNPQKVMDYCFTANMKPDEENPDLSKPMKFTTRSGKGFFVTQNPAASAVYYEIVKSGKRPLSAHEAIERASQHKGVTSEAARKALLENGLQLALRGFLMLHIGSPAFVDTPSERPLAYPLARLQASRPGCTAVTSALGQSVPVKDVATLIIPLLDGTRTLDDVTEVLVKAALDGKINVREKDTPVTDKATIRLKLETSVKNITAQLARAALLVA